MAYLSKIDVKNILDNAPPELDKGKIVQSLVEQGNQLEGFDQIAPTPLTQGGSDGSNDGLLTRIGKGIVKDVAQPFARAAVTGYDIAKAGGHAIQATGDAIRGDKTAEQQHIQQGFDELRSRNLPIVGEVKPLALAGPEEGAGAVARSFADVASAGASAASNFIGGEGAIGAAGRLGKG
nr:hypothetical protein [Acidobacteriota bacterium]